MSGFDNEVLFAKNVDFTGTSPISGQINQNGELLVGSASAPFIRAYVPTGSSGVTISTGPGTIDLSLANVPNSALANSSITINTGTGITGGGNVPLGASVNVGLQVPVLVANGGTGVATLTNHGVLIGQGTSAITATAVGSTGQVLQGNTGANPTYSTATYPSVASGTGTILRADGTNWVATTATYPATTTVSQILYSSSTNVVGGISTANNSVVLTDGSGVPSLGTSLSNDFTFTSSTAGATRTLTVSNTNNSNAASTALIQTTVGGTSAGDALTTYTVTGSSSWSVGVDNSDTQAFVISGGTALGTNNVMRVNGGGEINYPLQSAFMALLHTGVSNVTGDGTTYTNIYDTEVFDQNNDFTLASSTYTAPITGRVLLCYQGYVQGGTSITTATAFGSIVTSNRTYTNKCYLHPATTAGCSCNMSVLADMDVGDTSTTTMQTTDTGGKIDDMPGDAAGVRNFFSGNIAC